MLNYTFGLRVLTYSRNWSYLFKTEQNCPSIIIFVAFFVLPSILSSKNAGMENEHLSGNANLENDINMSLKQQFLILKNNITFHKLKKKQIIIEIISSIYNSFSHRFIIPLHHTNTIIDTQHTIFRSIFTNSLYHCFGISVPCVVLYFWGFVYVQAAQREKKGENNNKQQRIRVAEWGKHKSIQLWLE